MNSDPKSEARTLSKWLCIILITCGVATLLISDLCPLSMAAACQSNNSPDGALVYARDYVIIGAAAPEVVRSIKDRIENCIVLKL
jgi:hypothetical protein